MSVLTTDVILQVRNNTAPFFCFLTESVAECWYIHTLIHQLFYLLMIFTAVLAEKTLQGCQCWSLSRSLSPLLWSRLKFLDNYWMDCRDMWYRQSWPPSVKPTDFVVPTTFTLTVKWFWAKCLSIFSPKCWFIPISLSCSCLILMGKH